MSLQIYLLHGGWTTSTRVKLASKIGVLFEIDILATVKEEVNERNVAIECKNWNESCVASRDATHFVHKLNALNIREGIFVANSGFSEDAFNILNNESVTPVKSLGELAALKNRYNYSGSGQNGNSNQSDNPLDDYYMILGVPRDAPRETIKWMYDGLARKWHPDNHPNEDSKFYNEKMQEINEAYEILSDPEKRKDYDKQLGPTEETGNQSRNQDHGQSRAPYSNDFGGSGGFSERINSESISDRPDTSGVNDKVKITIASIVAAALIAGTLFAITGGMFSVQQDPVDTAGKTPPPPPNITTPPVKPLTVLLDDTFDSENSGWTLFGSRTKPVTISFDTSQGGTAPSIVVSYTKQSSSFLADQPFEDAGIQKTVDLSSWDHQGPLVLSFDYRAKSSEAGFAKMNVLILDSDTGNTVFRKNTSFTEGDTGWKSFSSDISYTVLNVKSLKVIMWFNDVGRTSSNWYDNIMLQASTDS